MTLNHSCTVAVIQQSVSEDVNANLEKSVLAIRDAARQGAQIIGLQELFRSRYFCQDENTQNFALAETVPGPTTRRLSDLARELEVVLIAPLFEKRAEGIYHNSAVVLDADGSLAGHYRKMHIPDDPNFYEKFYFTPGDRGFKCFQTRYGRVGVLICWDQWFPEAARLTALAGAQILFYPTAIGFQEADRSEATRQANAWQTIQKSHAIANGVFVASANRVGQENNIQFWGQSFISDPMGGILAQAGDQSDEIVIAQCDWSFIESTRQNWPFLRDRRIDAYSGLSRLYLDDE